MTSSRAKGFGAFDTLIAAALAIALVAIGTSVALNEWDAHAQSERLSLSFERARAHSATLLIEIAESEGERVSVWEIDAARVPSANASFARLVQNGREVARTGAPHGACMKRAVLHNGRIAFLEVCA